MRFPQWARTGKDTFWRRHYELATLAEEACEQAIEQRYINGLERSSSEAGRQQRKRLDVAVCLVCQLTDSAL
jgi:hypothetical protein